MAAPPPGADPGGVSSYQHPQTRQAPSPLQEVSWPLVLGLGAFALVRPLLNITGVADALGRPATPLLATLVISLVWVVVAATRARQPLLTLVLAGITYAVLSVILSGVLSVLLEGELQGPLTNPVGIVGVLVTNVIWGAITGVIALVASGRRD